jgi:hypothetical protein
MLPCQSILFAKTNIMLLNNVKFQIDLFNRIIPRNTYIKTCRNYRQLRTRGTFPLNILRLAKSSESGLHYRDFPIPGIK